MDMLKVEVPTCLAVMLSLATTTAGAADVGRELARCQLEAERLYPAPDNKSIENWPERAANLQKRAEYTEPCMRAAGYSLTAEFSVPLETYESCMKIADEVMRGPSASLYHGADWNKICLDNEWDVRNQQRLSEHCYQSGSWWRRWFTEGFNTLDLKEAKALLDELNA